MASPTFILKRSQSLSRIAVDENPVFPRHMLISGRPKRGLYSYKTFTNVGLTTRSIPSCSYFCTHQLSDKEPADDIPSDDNLNSEDSDQKDANTAVKASVKPPVDVGIYKAILLGEVGKFPVQKKLRSGRTVTAFTVGTGGKHKYGTPIEGETSKKNAGQDMVQWHRVTIHLETLGGIAMQHVKKGAHVYVEGNLETQIFSDPISGLIKRIREVAIRRGGRLIFLDGGSSTTNEVQETEVSQV